MGTTLETRIKSSAKTPLKIAVHHFSSDFRVLHDAVNQGIDSHLEAVRFVELQRDENDRRVFEFGADTIHVLVRRLSELDYCRDTSEEHDREDCEECSLTENAESWASNICDHYGIDFWG